MTAYHARVTAIGSYVPNQIMTNHDLEKLVETNDEWIVQRTGIKERRIAGQTESTSDLAYQAAMNLKQRYNTEFQDVDMIIICTMTPDFKTPSTASLVQAKLGINHAGVIDLNAACAGFTYGLHLANGLISSGLHKKILVIGAETLSNITDYADRNTCILFGDGSGAVLVERDEVQSDFISFYLNSEGEKGVSLYCSNLSNHLFEDPIIPTNKLIQNGREVYKWAVSTVPRGMKQVVDQASMTLDQIDWFIPHSANLRMIQSICEKSNVPFDKALYSLIHFGNTSAASIPLSLDIGVTEGKIKTGDLLLLYGFGGGLTQAGLLMKWSL
ncbi:ketoacyl-ACP synthase III [Exiguobacterium sp.]|uniref:ketoacyl-ACP synthase III n=2 Tax=Exiguobacterium sp. TaxID=44751 RepID=UPI002899A5D4|nr:ketoacyl-ACP synthase III [Exiguobacterium sp.]